MGESVPAAEAGWRDVPPAHGEGAPAGLPTLVRRAFRDPAALAAKVRRVRGMFDDWGFYWIARISGAPAARVYRVRDGPRLWLRTRSTDFYVVEEVYRHRLYDAGPERIGGRDVVVDVGAHIGAFTVLASLAAPRGRVIALEPVPENRALLERNVRLNGGGNVTVLPFAMAAEAGRRTLQVSRWNTGGHSFFRASADAVDVECVTLPDVLERAGAGRVDLLKMDCEGAEHEILEATPGEALRGVRRMVLEYHDLSPERDASTLERKLRDAGFAVRRSPTHTVLYAARPG